MPYRKIDGIKIKEIIEAKDHVGVHHSNVATADPSHLRICPMDRQKDRVYFCHTVMEMNFSDGLQMNLFRCCESPHNQSKTSSLNKKPR